MLQEKYLQELVNEYVQEYSRLKSFTIKTQLNKRNVFRRFLTFLGRNPVTLDTVQAYVRDMQQRGVNANSIKTEVANIKALLRWLTKKKKIEHMDWANDIESPKVHHIPEQLTDIDKAEAAIIAGTEPGKDDHKLHRERKALMRFAMQFALRTGVRGNELIHIRGKDLFISDLSPNESKVYLSDAKGGTGQWQPLPIDMLEELKKHVTDDLVFPINIGTCSGALKRGAKIVGIPDSVKMHPHILRKIFGTTLARSLPMVKVCQLMRHSDISITQKFYITYGISELGYDLTATHPLIRLALAPEDVIKTFLEKETEQYFGRDKRIKLSTKHDPEKKKFIVEINY